LLRPNMTSNAAFLYKSSIKRGVRARGGSGETGGSKACPSPRLAKKGWQLGGGPRRAVPAGRRPEQPLLLRLLHCIAALLS
jgi:hypothetical protein